MPAGDFMKTLQASGDKGPSYALDQLRKNPTWIQQIVLEMSTGLFLPEAVLRKGPPAVSGAIAYREAEPLFSDDDISVVGEFGTYPAMTSSRGPVRVSATQKRGGSIFLSQEMIGRGAAAEFAENTKRATNTFARTWSKVFLNEVLTNPDVPQMTVRAAVLEDGWHGEDELEVVGGQGIRKDLANAQYEIQNAYKGQIEQKYGYNANTLVLHPLTGTSFINNDELNKIFMMSDKVSESLVYKFTAPKRFFNTDIMYSWDMPVDSEGVPTKALLLERNTLGFISDERPFRTTPLYENKDNETWRSNMSRISTMAIDNPKAAIWLNGINGIHSP